MDEQHISEADLVAFFDGELARSRREFVAEHVASCSACRDELEIQTLSRAAIQSLPMSRPSDEAWTMIGREIERMNQMDNISISSRSTRLRPVRGLRITVVAASVALLVLSIVVLNSLVFSGEDVGADGPPLLTATTPFDWGLFLNDLDHPTSESRFERSYSLTPVSLDKALQATGLAATGFGDRFPASVKIQSARLVELPGATAAQLEYDWDGDRVIVFYQRKETGLVFSGFIATRTTVREIPCLSVYCVNYRALATESVDGIFTVIARRGTDLVEHVIEYIID